MPSRPLEGLRVVDLTQVVSGAVATMLLADFGAEVVKVEPPGGEPYRRLGYPLRGGGETNLNIVRFSRGKKSVVLDLKTDEGKEALAALLARADLLVENFRPGVLTRLGFGAERLRELNPRLVYATVSGNGHDDLLPSPYRDRPAYAILTEAVAGLMHLAADRDGTPVWMGFAMADVFAGVLAFAGALLALRTRDETGEGRRVDVAMADAAMLMNDLPIAAYTLLGEVMGPGRYTLQAPWAAFPARDGHVAIAVLAEAEWAALCRLLERPDLAADERLATGRGRSRHFPELVEPAAAPGRRRARARRPIESEHAAARRMLLEVDEAALGCVRVVGNPIKVEGAERPELPRVPALGEHTGEVLRELGLAR